MVRAKITSKGQVTLPKHLRESLGLRPGDEIELTERQPGRFAIEKVKGESPFAKWVGYLGDLEGQDVDQLVREMRDDDPVIVRQDE